jgi:hypothetical protein
MMDNVLNSKEISGKKIKRSTQRAQNHIYIANSSRALKI